MYIDRSYLIYKLETLKDAIIDYTKVEKSIISEPFDLEIIKLTKKYYNFALDNGVGIALLKKKCYGFFSLFDVVNNPPWLFPKEDELKKLVLETHKIIISNLRVEEISNIEQNTHRTREDKFEFFIDDGIAKYGDDYYYKFKKKKKGYELLRYLYNNKGVSLSLQDIKAECNFNIAIEKHKFREEKDIDDTIIYIKRCLKVKKNEFFPISKSKNGWILAK